MGEITYDAKELFYKLTPEERKELTSGSVWTGLAIGISMGMILLSFAMIFGEDDWVHWAIGIATFAFGVWFGLSTVSGERQHEIKLICASEYCRSQGIFPEDVRWYSSPIMNWFDIPLDPRKWGTPRRRI